MSSLTIPPELAQAVEEDALPERFEWLAALPGVVAETAQEWRLELGEPYLPGGQCAWVAPVRGEGAEDLVLKAHWRHPEAEHEADALRFWDGDGAVRCFATKTLDDTTLLLLERCDPGVPLRTLPEPEQDVVIARLMLRLWERTPDDRRPFVRFEDMCARWADSLEQHCEEDPSGLDPGLAREGGAVMRELPRSADRAVLLCTDLHAGNVLSARREPWLVIDPKPFIGDPAFDPVQHMLNCERRLAADPIRLAERMGGLADVEPERIMLWLFARAVQEFHSAEMRELARRLAP